MREFAIGSLLGITALGVSDYMPPVPATAVACAALGILACTMYRILRMLREERIAHLKEQRRSRKDYRRSLEKLSGK